MQIAEIKAQLVEVLDIDIASVSGAAPVASKVPDAPDSDRLQHAKDLRRGLEDGNLDENDRRVVQRSLDILEASENQTEVFRKHIGAFVDRHAILLKLGLPDDSRAEVIESLREALGRVSIAFRGKMSRALRRSGQAELSIRRENDTLLARWNGDENASDSSLEKVLVDYLEPAFVEMKGLADAPAAIRQLGELLAEDLTRHGGLLPTFAPPVSRDDEFALAWRKEAHPVMEPDRIEVVLSDKAPEIATLLDRIQYGRCERLPSRKRKLPDVATVDALMSAFVQLTGFSAAVCANYFMRVVARRFRTCVLEGDEESQARMAHLQSVVKQYHTTPEG